jgi:hypothetical protein
MMIAVVKRRTVIRHDITFMENNTGKSFLYVNENQLQDFGVEVVDDRSFQGRSP